MVVPVVVMEMAITTIRAAKAAGTVSETTVEKDRIIAMATSSPIKGNKETAKWGSHICSVVSIFIQFFHADKKGKYD